MIDVKFSYNWNKKLDCHAFTTIRLYNPQKHFKGQAVRILLNDKYLTDGFIYDVSVFKIDQLNDFMAYVDTGYSAEEAKKILYKMYSKVDFKTQKLAMILIVKEEKTKAA